MIFSNMSIKELVAAPDSDMDKYQALLERIQLGEIVGLREYECDQCVHWEFRVDNLQAQVSEVTKEKKELEARIEELEGEIDDLKARLSESSDEA